MKLMLIVELDAEHEDDAQRSSTPSARRPFPAITV